MEGEHSNPKQVERWRVLELSFTSTQHYDNPYRDVNVDVHFTAPDGSVLTMPGFWYGENIWKVRFAPPTVGVGRYGSVCSSPSDTGLHQQTGTFNVTEYQGELDIYKHGFLKVSKHKRYLEHDDGTPFFWLGDTHWRCYLSATGRKPWHETRGTPDGLGRTARGVDGYSPSLA
jgi:Domain of unknown function (DUF5060)/Protein of unknown function (DUF4038)